MVYRYVPVLRWKRGERVGLRNLSAAAKQDVSPLFVIGVDQFKGKKATKSQPAVPPPHQLAQEIYAAWGTAPFYLDASPLGPASGSHTHPLAAIAAACRAAGMQLIPATSLSASTQYQNAVLSVFGTDQRGVGLRTDLQGMTSAAAWLPSWPIPVAQTDLLIDFADNVGTIVSLGPSLIHAFQTLHAASHWRSVTVLGTSMPDNFSGMTAGVHLIPRAEIQIWGGLSAAGLAYRVDYGDYATVPLGAPPSGIAWGYPINVRYTLPQAFLICRGVGTTGYGGVDMDTQLVGHATAIANYPQRGAIPCWADSTISAIASKAASPSGLEHWVQLGVNRHIELVRSILP